MDTPNAYSLAEGVGRQSGGMGLDFSHAQLCLNSLVETLGIAQATIRQK